MGLVANAGEALDITQGTMELGGSATVFVQALAGELGAGVSLLPQVGYFVSDHVELTGAVGLSLQAYGGIAFTTLSFEPGIQGVFGTGSARPFVGASFSISAASFNGEGATLYGVTVPVGVLLAVSDAVAISVGTNPSLRFDSGGGPPLITVPAGALGVRSFFR